MNNHPVAQVEPVANTTYYTFTDSLGTPLLLTRTDTSTFWRRTRTLRKGVRPPRQRRTPTATPPRPGSRTIQPRPNGATERSYNIFRWYRAGWGRYTQVDPILASLHLISALGGKGRGAPRSVEPYAYAALQSTFVLRCWRTTQQLRTTRNGGQEWTRRRTSVDLVCDLASSIPQAILMTGFLHLAIGCAGNETRRFHCSCDTLCGCHNSV
jgi:hypothetical protein